MTKNNEQIIIDDIDVSGCAYFGSTMFPTKNCTMDSEYLHSCESCYCYYKQLKKAMNQIVDLNKKVEAKEQECEELKKLLKVRIEDLCDSCGASSMMPMPCKVYEKTLTEIKEIAEWHTTKADSEDVQEDMKQILQKISECEV
jgi:hypothetical protein